MRLLRNETGGAQAAVRASIEYVGDIAGEIDTIPDTIPQTYVMDSTGRQSLLGSKNARVPQRTIPTASLRMNSCAALQTVRTFMLHNTNNAQLARCVTNRKRKRGTNGRWYRPAAACQAGKQHSFNGEHVKVGTQKNRMRSTQGSTCLS